MRLVLVASILSSAWALLSEHPGLAAIPVGLICTAIWGLLQRGDAVALAEIDALPLFHAHPDAAALLNRGNTLVMGFLKDALAVAQADAQGASTWNEALAQKIAADVLSKLRIELGLTAVATAATAVGGEANLVDHFAQTAKVFITAPSGRTIVAPAPVAAAPAPANP
jgi:hypothetical protein